MLDKLDGAIGANRTIFVVNLFPNKAPVPSNLREVAVRTQNLQFANKTLQDLKLMSRFDEVAALIEALESLPDGNPLKDHPAYRAVAKRKYIRVPGIVSITRPEQVEEFGGSDFSPETIEQRASEGYRQTEIALRQA